MKPPTMALSLRCTADGVMRYINMTVENFASEIDAIDKRFPA